MYLRSLLKHEDREFEEVKYYEELLLTLYNPMSDQGLSKIAGDIDQRLRGREKLGPVNFVGESANFNFVHKGDRYLAVAKALGSTDLFVERLGERELSPFVLLGSTLDEVQAKTVDLEHSSKPVKLVGESANFNFVHKGERYLAVAKHRTDGLIR